MSSEIEAIFVVCAAIVAGLLGSINQCTVYNACKEDTCGNTSLSCSFQNHVSLVGDRFYDLSTNASLAVLTRGVCAPGERMQIDAGSGKQRCLPFRPWPDALDSEIMDLSKTKPHERYCGAWLDAQSSIALTRSKSQAFYHEDNVADEIRRVEATKFNSPYLSGTDIGKFHSLCTHSVLGGSGALRKSAIGAYKYLQQMMPPAMTKEDALKSLGVLASHHCPTPVLIGATMDSPGYAAQATHGYKYEKNDLAKLLYALEASEGLQYQAEQGNAIVNDWSADLPEATLADFDLIFVGATGIQDSNHVVLKAKSTPLLSGFLSLVDSGRFDYVQGYLHGLAASCSVVLQHLADASLGAPDSEKHDHLNPIKIAIDHLKSQRPATPALERIFGNKPRFATFEAEDLNDAMVAGFAQLEGAPMGDASDDCTSLTRYIFPDRVDELRFEAVVPDNLYVRLEHLVDDMRVAVYDTMQNYAPVRDALTFPTAVLSAINDVKFRIPGAPVVSWAGSMVPHQTIDFDSDDGVFVVMLKQAKEIFRRRVNNLIYDQRDVCDGPSMRDSVETNAFIYPSSGCSFLLLGLLRRPFADARYNDLSLSLRVGYVIAHEIGHLELLVGNHDAPYNDLLQLYDENVRSEGFADIIAVASIIRAGMATREEACAHISQIWCAAMPLVYENTGVHPAPNERGDLLCATLERLGL